MIQIKTLKTIMIHIKNINMIITMIIMDIKTIIHMEQRNIGKRKEEININMMDIQINTNKTIITKNHQIIIFKILLL